MKKYLLVMILLSMRIFAQYTTPNTGVNWNLDDLVTNSGGVVTGAFPNYTVNNKITVSANDQVNVLAGSIVAFTSAFGQFEVNGIFKAIGTQTDSIIFTSTTQDSTGFYYGFSFNASPNDTASIISYAKIFYADYGMRCISASPTISNSYLFKCGRGVQLSSSNSKILNNIIERSYEYGITMTLGSSPLIEGNTLIKNNTQGTSAKNQISIGLQGDNSPIIRNNIIYGGTSIPTGGISLWVSGSAAFSNTVIDGNEIYNNAFGITLLSSSNGIINALVKNNLIYNNKINPNALVSGSGINVNGSPTNQPIITQNEIYGNWWGVTIQNGTTVQAGPSPNLGNLENVDTTDDGMNIIYGNVQGADTFDVYNNCTNDVFAHNNDWRIYDSISIEQHVFHKVDDGTHGLVKFVPFSAQIPVELTSFAASVIDGDVVLNWVTATELNNSGFEIQRNPSPTPSLKEGALEQFNWIKIGFLSGSGTSTEVHNYLFSDQSPYAGKSYYRLKQMDFDGSYEYSSIVEVDFNLPIEFSLEQNYPNPFNPTTKIRYTIPRDEKRKMQNVSLKVYDVLGNEVTTLVNEQRESGFYEVDFNSSSFTSGVYFYQLKAGPFLESKKMLLLK
jgi:parallel beta-helix repeat protein